MLIIPVNHISGYLHTVQSPPTSIQSVPVHLGGAVLEPSHHIKFCWAGEATWMQMIAPDR